ncbi:hypothetical protein [Subtercola endophyticus]|uniref:hypothetical protein n=1 Tax=Subtercola endophyticus TaxID=2895559 RepID=UPI001E4D6F6B|nr:hypothetical protein [Subtercola endophyticus]UFS59208.1 hypothetical protein LQ955_19900 [Subtercola endophyticus]
MTSGPSILFTEFATRTDPVLRGWADFRAQVLAGARTAQGRTDARGAAEPTSEPRTRRTDAAAPGIRSGIWRLVAPNHREVARSLYLYESLSQAKDHVRDLQDGDRVVTVRLVKGPFAGQHGWVASVDDVAIMSCGRWYSASSLGRESAQYSLEALKSARLAETSRATSRVASPNRAAVRSGAQKEPAW